MTRKITDHIVNPANDTIQITVMDPPGSGGANHEYEIESPGILESSEQLAVIEFQNGAIEENGLNGVTHEALLAICIDRLRCFQAGPFSCRENALALTKMEEALHWLHARTRERMTRGVEGKEAK